MIGGWGWSEVWWGQGEGKVRIWRWGGKNDGGERRK